MPTYRPLDTTISLFLWEPQISKHPLSHTEKTVTAVDSCDDRYLEPLKEEFFDGQKGVDFLGPNSFPFYLLNAGQDLFYEKNTRPRRYTKSPRDWENSMFLSFGRNRSSNRLTASFQNEDEPLICTPTTEEDYLNLSNTPSSHMMTPPRDWEDRTESPCGKKFNLKFGPSKEWKPQYPTNPEIPRIPIWKPITSAKPIKIQLDMTPKTFMRSLINDEPLDICINIFYNGQLSQSRVYRAHTTRNSNADEKENWFSGRRLGIASEAPWVVLPLSECHSRMDEYLECQTFEDRWNRTGKLLLKEADEWGRQGKYDIFRNPIGEYLEELSKKQAPKIPNSRSTECKKAGIIDVVVALGRSVAIGKNSRCVTEPQRKLPKANCDEIERPLYQAEYLPNHKSAFFTTSSSQRNSGDCSPSTRSHLSSALKRSSASFVLNKIKQRNAQEPYPQRLANTVKKAGRDRLYGNGRTEDLQEKYEISTPPAYADTKIHGLTTPKSIIANSGTGALSMNRAEGYSSDSASILPGISLSCRIHDDKESPEFETAPTTPAHDILKPKIPMKIPHKRFLEEVEAQTPDRKRQKCDYPRETRLIELAKQNSYSILTHSTSSPTFDSDMVATRSHGSERQVSIQRIQQPKFEYNQYLNPKSSKNQSASISTTVAASLIGFIVESATSSISPIKTKEDDGSVKLAHDQALNISHNSQSSVSNIIGLNRSSRETKQIPRPASSTESQTRDQSPKRVKDQLAVFGEAGSYSSSRSTRARYGSLQVKSGVSERADDCTQKIFDTSAETLKFSAKEALPREMSAVQKPLSDVNNSFAAKRRERISRRKEPRDGDQEVRPASGRSNIVRAGPRLLEFTTQKIPHNDGKKVLINSASAITRSSSSTRKAERVLNTLENVDQLRKTSPGSDKEILGISTGAQKKMEISQESSSKLLRSSPLIMSPTQGIISGATSMRAFTQNPEDQEMHVLRNASSETPQFPATTKISLKVRSSILVTPDIRSAQGSRNLPLKTPQQEIVKRSSVRKITPTAKAMSVTPIQKSTAKSRTSSVASARRTSTTVGHQSACDEIWEPTNLCHNSVLSYADKEHATHWKECWKDDDSGHMHRITRSEREGVFRATGILMGVRYVLGVCTSE